MDDKLEFLSQPIEDEPITDIAETPQEPEPAPEPVAEQPPEAPAPVVEEPKQEAQSVPLPTFLDMRDKLKDAERRAREAESKLTPPETPAMPDAWEDPNAALQHQQAMFDQRLYQQTLAISRRFAEQAHGKETTEQAVDWGMQRCDADPYFNAQVRSSPDPIGFVVEQFNRDRIASTVNLTEYEQFQAWKAAQAQITPPQPARAQPVPTPSMAASPSAGGVDHVPTGPGQAFDSLFTK